jgi:hypothetical protein
VSANQREPNAGAIHCGTHSPPFNKQPFRIEDGYNPQGDCPGRKDAPIRSLDSGVLHTLKPLNHLASCSAYSASSSSLLLSELCSARSGSCYEEHMAGACRRKTENFVRGQITTGKLRVWMPNVATCCTWLHFLKRSIATSVKPSTKRPLEVVQGPEIGCRGWI